MLEYSFPKDAVLEILNEVMEHGLITFLEVTRAKEVGKTTNLKHSLFTDSSAMPRKQKNNPQIRLL